MIPMQADASALLTRVLGGSHAALARAITLIDSDHGEKARLLDALPDASRTTPVIGFTGAPGVGKSTLINAYVARCRSENLSVAVVSVDPSSPISGGAILGDRLRMSQHGCDNRVFIRSLAARGHLGGLCRNIEHVIRVIDAAGWDRIVVETVGTGQSEVEIAAIADINVVISAPGMGDAIQAMKSGILEIAQVLVVNKADMPGAADTARELRAMLKLRPARPAETEVVETVATHGTGIDELFAAIDARRRSRL